MNEYYKKERKRNFFKKQKIKKGRSERKKGRKKGSKKERMN